MGEPPELAERTAAIAVLDLYAEAIDRRRWDLLEAIFAEHVTWFWPDSSSSVGRDTVIGELRHHLRHGGPSHCIFGGYRVAIDGERATAKAHRRCYFSDAAGRERFMESLGTYEVELGRGPGGWVITEFRETVSVRRGSADVFKPADAPDGS